MEKKLIIGFSTLLLAACSTGSYVKDVQTESHQEVYQTAQTVTAPAPMTEQSMQSMSMPSKATVTGDNSDQSMSNNRPSRAKVAITPPSKKQNMKAVKRFGYTIQVVAVGTQNKVDVFAAKLPQMGEPIWENYKVVNGTKWYTVLYGDFASRTDAKMAISRLPKELQRLKPFVKSIDEIKRSEYPTLNKLN